MKLPSHVAAKWAENLDHWYKMAPTEQEVIAAYDALYKGKSGEMALRKGKVWANTPDTYEREGMAEWIDDTRWAKHKAKRGVTTLSLDFNMVHLLDGTSEDKAKVKQLLLNALQRYRTDDPWEAQVQRALLDLR
jgi:hypothetical protein